MNSPTLALLELTLKGTAVLLAGYGGALLLARASAAQRSLGWLGVFATMLFLPLALIVHPVWSLPVPVASPPLAAPAEPVALDLPEVSAAAIQPANPHLSPGAWLAALYGCGLAGVLGLRLLGAAQLWKLRRHAPPHAAGQAIAEAWRAEVQLRRPVQVCANPRVTVPMTYGTWRPVILLPATGLDGVELSAALRHEFTHIRHGDAARRWLGTVVCALWWPHPLVWAAFRAWKLEQERACDDAVLNSGANAADYAQQLLDAARQARLSRLQSAGALVMATPGGLETRLRSVVSPQVNRAPARLISLLPIGALALALTLGGLAFQTRSATAAPAAGQEEPEVLALQRKAEATIIPQISAREFTIGDLIAVITKASGIKIIYTPKKENDARISLELRNVPAAEAIRYAASLANLTYTYQNDGVHLADLTPEQILKAQTSQAFAPAPVPAPEPTTTDAFRTREWKIPANFPSTLPKSARPRSAQEDLTAGGIVFPAGSSAVYSADHTRLIVRNTQPNLDLIDALVEMSAKKAPRPAGR